MNLIKFVSISLILLMTLSSCGLYKPVSARDTPVRGEDRARKNVKEGRGIAIGDAVKEEKALIMNLVLLILCGELHLKF